MLKKGFTFVEMLVSLALLSLLLLTTEAVQFIASQQTLSSYYYAVATQQLTNMLERLPSTHFDTDFAEWNNQNQSVLPAGRGNVTGTYPHYTLSLFWGKIANQDCKQNKIGPSGCLKESVNITTLPG